MVRRAPPPPAPPSRRRDEPDSPERDNKTMVSNYTLATGPTVDNDPPSDSESDSDSSVGTGFVSAPSAPSIGTEHTRDTTKPPSSVATGRRYVFYYRLCFGF